MPAWMCCTPKGTNRQREDSYRVAESNTAKYTWEQRDNVDLSHFKMTEIEGKLEIRRNIKGQQFIIENCKDSVLLVLDHTATVTMDDCSNCFVVIGPCSGSVFIRDCSKCTVVAICQQLRTRDCQNLVLSLHCTTNPIIENSRPVNLYPIHIDYEGINENIQSSKLSPFANNWRDVHDFTPDRYTPNYTFNMTTMPIRKEHAALLEPFKEITFEPIHSFFISKTIVKDEEENDDKETAVLYTTQATSETVEVFYARCLSLSAAARRKSVVCDESRDILATKGDVQLILNPQVEFVSGHVVSLSICGKHSVEAVKQLVVDYPEWNLVEPSFQNQFKMTINKLVQASLAV